MLPQKNNYFIVSLPFSYDDIFNLGRKLWWKIILQMYTTLSDCFLKMTETESVPSLPSGPSRGQPTSYCSHSSSSNHGVVFFLSLSTFCSVLCEHSKASLYSPSTSQTSKSRIDEPLPCQPKVKRLPLWNICGQGSPYLFDFHISHEMDWWL